MRIYAKRLLTAKGFATDCVVTVKNGYIAKIGAYDQKEPVDARAHILTPGLIDLHIHGGEGFNARDFDLDTIEPFLKKLLACGVTDFLMTISTGRRETMRHGLEVTQQAMALQRQGRLRGAHILGAHLEGPFLSTERPGAMQMDAIIKPSIAAYEEMFAGYEDVIRKISLAPEEAGADALIAHLLQKNVIVQAGHSNATFEEARHAFSLGVGSLCHTFNACRPIHHRDPGVITAALVSPDVYCEAICDLEHLHAGTLQLVYGMKGPDRIILVSDSVATHGLPDGEYFMEGYHIVVKNGVSHTAGGALDGGGVYLDGAVRNIQSLGVSEVDSIIMATQTPAKRMLLSDLGTIGVCKRAHLTAWNPDWSVDFTILDNQIYREGIPV